MSDKRVSYTEKDKARFIQEFNDLCLSQPDYSKKQFARDNNISELLSLVGLKSVRTLTQILKIISVVAPFFQRLKGYSTSGSVVIKTLVALLPLTCFMLNTSKFIMIYIRGMLGRMVVLFMKLVIL